MNVVWSLRAIPSPGRDRRIYLKGLGWERGAHRWANSERHRDSPNAASNGTARPPGWNPGTRGVRHAIHRSIPGQARAAGVARRVRWTPAMATKTLTSGYPLNPAIHIEGCQDSVVIDGVSFRQHPLMQDAGNENASRLTPEKHDVPALFHAAQARANAIAGATPEDGLSASLCNTLQGRRYNAGSGLCPTYAGCRRRYPSGRHRQGGINGMQPTASASSREA